ncbi:MAG TPA: M50 family metallopeptidase, partial [Bacillota bacterium]|nr:M50 family metallopeptidase [Bacillota bacterium]HQE09921.1 M50 family metallopeptidase [Bacillota bacterium]
FVILSAAKDLRWLHLPLGSLFGIRIRLHPLFLLLALFCFITGSGLEFALVCLIIVWHEFAHGFAGRRLGLHISEIELYPFGGVAKFDEQLELEPYIERRLAWAGPASNLALAGLGILLYTRIGHGASLLFFFVQANLTLAAFNLMPALPLDGGRILRACLTPRLGFRAATEQAALLGQILAGLLFAIGLAGLYYSYFNLSLPLIAVFLFVAATKEKQQAVYTFIRALGAKEHQLFKRGALRGAQLIVLEETRLLDVFRLFLPQRYHFIRVMDRSQHCHTEISEASLIRAALKKGLDIPIKKIL